MVPLTDPERLRERASIAFREETFTVDAEELATWEPLAGVGVLGVTRRNTVLLMDGPHGWRLPYYAVESDEDWLAVGRAVGAALTGSPVEIAGVERVTRVERQLEDGGDSHVTHDVLLRAMPAAGDGSVGNHYADRVEHVEATDWFDAVPAAAYREHEDTVPDICRFLGENPVR
jgi:hypothetical protein